MDGQRGIGGEAGNACYAKRGRERQLAGRIAKNVVGQQAHSAAADDGEVLHTAKQRGDEPSDWHSWIAALDHFTKRDAHHDVARPTKGRADKARAERVAVVGIDRQP